VFASAASLLNPPSYNPPSDQAWPFQRSDASTLKASKKKVFAHHMEHLPIWATANSANTGDGYASNNLTSEQPCADRCSTEHGALYRERPLFSLDPVIPDEVVFPPPLFSAPLKPDSSAWEFANYEEEIRRAIAIGIDGFSVDVYSYPPPNCGSTTQQPDA